jgi:hypothetical protein
MRRWSRGAGFEPWKGGGGLEPVGVLNAMRRYAYPMADRAWRHR